MRPTLRRLAAFAVDYLLIAAYLVGLVAASLAVLASPLGPRYRGVWISPWSAELAGFLLLTGPVLLYFALSEASAGGATVGKHILHLKVVGPGLGQLTVGRSLARSGLKFLPWELAHFSIWQYLDAGGRPPAWTAITLIMVYVLVAAYLISLSIGARHRTLYDRIAGSLVLEADPVLLAVKPGAVPPPAG